MADEITTKYTKTMYIKNNTYIPIFSHSRPFWNSPSTKILITKLGINFNIITIIPEIPILLALANHSALKNVSYNIFVNIKDVNNEIIIDYKYKNKL